MPAHAKQQVTNAGGRYDYGQDKEVTVAK